MTIKTNARKKKNMKITCICYGQAREFGSRKKAEQFFWDCVENSEGSERDRYITILSQLKRGKTLCTD